MTAISQRLTARRFRPAISATVATALLAGLAYAGGDVRQKSEAETSLEICAVRESPHTVRTRFGEPSWHYLRTTERALERLRSKVEEWGVATISAPVGIFKPGAFHIPDEIFSLPALYNEVKTERVSGAAQSSESGISNQLGVVATPMLPFPTATAPAGGSASNTTTSTTTVTNPAPPSLFDDQGTIRPSLDAESLGAPAKATAGGFGGVAAPFKLFEGTAPLTGSTSANMRRASNIAIEQKIFSAMSDPRSVADDVVPLFCVVQVSVNPGWRTQQHYLADVAASLEYHDLCHGKSISRAARRQPQVFSVLPLIDAQTVEMANSQREVTQLAFRLAASLPARGVDIKAKDIFEFVKRFSKDSRSVAPIPTVNSYSSGNTFGFRFAPSFLAMKDPAQKRAREGNVLLPTSFPALITVLVRRNDIANAVAAMLSDRGSRDAVNLNNLPAGFSIMTHCSTRWYLKDRAPLWQVHKRLFSPMKRDTAAMEVGAAEDVAIVYEAKNWFAHYEGMKRARDGSYIEQPRTIFSRPEPVGGPKWSATMDEVRRQLLDMESKALGHSWPIEISGSWWVKSRQASRMSRDEADRQEADSLNDARRAGRAEALGQMRKVLMGQLQEKAPELHALFEALSEPPPAPAPTPPPRTDPADAPEEQAEPPIKVSPERTPALPEAGEGDSAATNRVRQPTAATLLESEPVLDRTAIAVASPSGTTLAAEPAVPSRRATALLTPGPEYWSPEPVLPAR